MALVLSRATVWGTWISIRIPLDGVLSASLSTSVSGVLHSPCMHAVISPWAPTFRHVVWRRILPPLLSLLSHTQSTLVCCDHQMLKNVLLPSGRCDFQQEISHSYSCPSGGKTASLSVFTFFSVICFQRFNYDVSWYGFLESLALPWWRRW